MVGGARGQIDSREYSLSVHIETAEGADLVRADEFIEDGQIEEAVETIRRVLEDEGEKLLAIKADDWTSQHGYTCYVPVRELCHLRLAMAHRLAPEALASYRRRVDPLARRWYDDAVRRRDDMLLRRIVEQMFVSSYGDNALFQLSEIALERGEFAKARGYLERIDRQLRAPKTADETLGRWSARPLWLAIRDVDLDEKWDDLKPLVVEPQFDSWLAYPDTDLELADVRARLVLASILEGNHERAEIERTLLQKLHPDAEGKIGGKTGVYHEQLKTLIEVSRGWDVVPNARGWPTFAGSTSRSSNGRRDLDFRPTAIWQVDLLPVSTEREFVGLGRPRIAEDGRGALSYHPLVVGDLVLWNTSKRILAHRLRDVEPVWGFIGGEDGEQFRQEIYPSAGGDEQAREFEAFPSPRRPHLGAPRFTMTAHGNKVFGRLGDVVTGSRDAKEQRQRTQRSYLVGIDLAKQGKMLPEFPILPDRDVRWEFEGAPISDGSRLYVAMRYTTREGALPELHVACYPLPAVQLSDDILQRPPVWRTKICNAETPAGGELDEVTHVLLSMHEGTIYCNTNMGAVAAIEPSIGDIKWLTRYPRSPLRPTNPDRSDLHYFRDLNPCLCHQDMVVVAPADCDQIFALDSVSGRPIWENSNVDAIHLLGVGANHLIASGLYLYWIDVFTGETAAQFPAKRGGAKKGIGRPTPHGYGRGILSGGRVVWPTRESILVFDQRIEPDTRLPRLTRQPIQFANMAVGTGNLVLADDVLLIAGPDKLYAIKNDSDDGK